MVRSPPQSSHICLEPSGLEVEIYLVLGSPSTHGKRESELCKRSCRGIEYLLDMALVVIGPQPRPG